jgi:ribosomal protein S18 acetylase RimI-like enzyme
MITIRPGFAPEEVPRLYELECLCFEPPIRWEEKDFLPGITKMDVWVAEKTDCDCGFCNPIKEIIGFLAGEVRRNQGYIGTINVDPKHRRRGIAAKLLTAAEDFYRKGGFTEVRLEVEQNNPAQTLYFKMGYRVHAVRKGWYEDGSTALYMIKIL